MRVYKSERVGSERLVREHKLVGEWPQVAATKASRAAMRRMRSTLQMATSPLALLLLALGHVVREKIAP